MAGKPGRSGGARLNTGPKPKSFTVKLDQLLLLNWQRDGKMVSIEALKVSEITRKEIICKHLQLGAGDWIETGDIVKIVR